MKIWSALTMMRMKLNASLHQQGCVVFLSRFSIAKGNKVSLDHSIIKQTKIRIDGKGNHINIAQGYLWKCSIHLTGNDNEITIAPHTKLNLTQIVLRGNGCRISIGEGSTFGSAYIVCMGQGNSIDIGTECMFAENIEVWNTDSHPILDTDGNILNPSKPIRIGNHVWCGKRTTILKGVTIGDGSIIGMGAVVTHDIAPHSLCTGIPARVLRTDIDWQRQFINE